MDQEKKEIINFEIVLKFYYIFFYRTLSISQIGINLKYVIICKKRYLIITKLFLDLSILILLMCERILCCQPFGIQLHSKTLCQSDHIINFSKSTNILKIIQRQKNQFYRHNLSKLLKYFFRIYIDSLGHLKA